MSQHPTPAGRVMIVRGPRVLAVLLLICGLLPTGLRAQPGAQRPPSMIYPETSSVAEALLKTAASHVREAQWDSAVELYQRAIVQFPEALTALSPEARGAVEDEPTGGLAVYVNVSDYAQRQMALMPPEALKTYRNRVDAEARLLFEQGRDRLDPAPLRRVVESFFCSSWGDDAVELLADLAFQDGRFDEASSLYRRLLPPSEDSPEASVYPDPSIDVARVLAKAILCDEASGRGVDPEALRQFAEQYPEAEGQLAGRSGRYLEILASALGEDALQFTQGLDARWPTFAGDPTRTKVLPEPVEPGELVWSIPFDASFDTASNLNASPPRFGLDPGNLRRDDSPSFFPVLQGDELLLTDGKEIQSYTLEGRPGERPVPAPAWRANLPAGSPSAARPTFGVERHTLTVVGDRIYARLGSSGAEFQMRNNVSAPSTTIVALDRRRPDAPLWMRTADEVIAAPDQPNGAALRGQVAFGGAPLADEHGVYVTMLKPGTQTLTWVACLEPDSGRTKWVRFVCAGTSPGFSRGDGFRNRGLIVNPELGHRLLTIGGSTIYYQTDLGALASIDTRSGRINWLSAYPRVLDAPTRGVESINHNPAVVFEDRVIISPEDSDRIFAFDRVTGRLAWEVNPGGRVAHLLGVADGKVVATGNHVWTIGVRSGEIHHRWPEGQTLEEGYGRGLLADGEIYWPTRDRLYILDQQTGRPTDRPPIDLRAVYGCGGGNLVAGDGYLAIAGKDYLRVFCKPSRMLRYYEDRIAADPDEPSNYYRLARTANALGNHELALRSFDRSLERAGPGDRVDGRRLVEVARAERYQILMTLANRLLAEGQPGAAIDRLEQAVASAPGLRDRLTARLALADATAEAGDHAGAVDVLQALLDEPEVRQVDLPADDRRSLRAELLIVDRLRELIQASGSQVYAQFEQASAELLRRGLDARDTRLLAEVVRSYPASTSAPEALAAIGSMQQEQENWPEAIDAYHRLVVSSVEDRHRALGLVGLARSYDAMGLATEAREAYRLVGSLYGSLEIELSGTPRRVDAYVAEQISAPEPGADPPASTLLRRSEPRRWPENFEPIGLEGSARAEGLIDDDSVVLIQGLELRGVDPGGDARWEVSLGERPGWSAVVGGRLVLASSDRIVGIDREAGTVLWEVSSGEGELVFGPSEVEPGGRIAPKAGPSGASFHEFRTYGDRLYFLRGDRDLVCFDPIDGKPHWTYRTSSVAIDPHLGLGLARVVVQLRMPNAIAVLDARDGRTLGQFPQEDSAGRWRRDPFAFALDRVLIVPDGETVELLDLKTGRAIWEASEESALPSSPRPSPSDPLVLGDAERLLVVRGEVVQRLDPENGEVLWETPLGRIRSDRRAEAIALGHEALFSISVVGSGVSVGAVAMQDGRTLWNGTLPGDLNETWGIGLTPDCVVAYRLDDGTPDTGPQEPIVLNLLRRDDGRRAQRLVVDAAGPRRRVGIAPGRITIAGSEGLWTLSSLDLDLVGMAEAAAAAGDRPSDGPGR